VVQSQPGKQFIRPYLKKPLKKKKWAGGVTQSIGSEFKLQYHKKKKKKKKERPIARRNPQKNCGLPFCLQGT
jgi:hypothetical protein